MEQKVTPELVRLVQVFAPRMSVLGGKFLNQMINAILGEWQIGASIGNDAWFALRVAAIEVLESLTFSDGKHEYRVDVEDIYITRQSLPGAKKDWMRHEEAVDILTKLGLLTDKMEEGERIEVILKHFFLPTEVIGDLEFDK